MSQAELIAELERITARMDGADPADGDALATLLERRAAVVHHLTSSGEVLDAAAAQALEHAREAGDRLMNRLKVLRASRRDEMGRLYHSGCLLRALRAEIRSDPQRVDCRG